MKNIILFLVLQLGIFLPSYSRISSKKIEVLPALKAELNAVLASADALHSACIQQDTQLIESKTEEVIASLMRAQERSIMAQVQKTHLVKILSAARSNFELSQNFSGVQKVEPLKEAFKDVVQMAQVFKLEPYNIFYCNKDKSLWLQKSSSPKNPIHPKRYGNCGRLVR